MKLLKFNICFRHVPRRRQVRYDIEPAMPVLLLCLLLAAPAAAQDRFRILFGGADTAVVDWSGELRVAPGSATIVAAYHFGAKEKYAATSWQAGNQWDGRLQMTPQDEAVFPKTRWKGVVADIDGGAGTRVTIATKQGTVEFQPAAVRYKSPLSLLDGRIRVERVPRTDSVSADRADEDYPALAAAPDGRVWVAWISFDGKSDVIKVRSSPDGKEWLPEETLTPQRGEYYQVALAAPRPGELIAVWSAIEKGAVHLFARELANGTWSAVRRLTDGPGPNTFPRMATGPNGLTALVWQSGAGGHTDVALQWRREGKWTEPVHVTGHPASDWEPAVAIDSRGETAVAWDSYRHGNYDIFLRRYSANGGVGPVERITASPDFEAHVSIVFDPRDRLWMAWDNGGPNWGKDHYGIDGIHRAESGLYFHRQVQVRVLDRGRLAQPAQPIDRHFPSGAITPSWMALGLESARRTFTEYPVLQVDGQGRVWAVVRTRTVGRANPPPVLERSIFPYWNYHVTMFDGQGWTEPVWVPFSDGRNEQRPGFAAGRDGSLWIATQTDGRSLPAADPRFGRYEVRAGRIAPAEVPAGSIDREYFIGASDLPAPRAVDDTLPVLEQPLWKTYQMEAGGRKYQVTWGDLHRHTDLSFDGYSDGSLYDAYRYAIDAARMDFLGPSEHMLPVKVDSPYMWWMVDKAVDVYKIPTAFYPLLNYERTVAFPDGHRNIVWNRRGYSPNRIYPGPGPTGAAEDDMVRLWKDLLGGGRRQAISIPHTTATQMGTDWRYNNPEAERLVEIFQGNRDSYEYYGAPRSAVAEQILVGGYVTSGAIRKEGYVWNALAKGYKLGFIASSDHRSTHMSYAAVYTPDRNYGAIWESLAARRTYAATDNIIVDFQAMGCAMGDEFATREVPRLDVRVIGTSVITQVDIIKDNAFVYTARPDLREVSFSFKDTSITPGEHYYYVRVIQDDNNMAWASPIWITYER